MTQLDATAVNVALPSIGRNLGGGVGGLQWVVDAYVLVLASVAMSGGGLGDRYGRRRVYRTGLTVFTLGSLGCSLAPALPLLVAARMLQAAGAAMLMPVTLSIITNLFNDPARRAWAIGVWIGVAGLATGIGPLAGGALTSGIGWRAIFWINLPIGAIALALTGPLIPESRAARPRPPDLGGQVLLVLTLATLTYALIQAPRNGWHSPLTLILLAAAAAGGLAFAITEARGRYPLIEPRYLRQPGFAGATLSATLAYLAITGFLFINSLYLQQVRGMSALAAGVALLPSSLALLAAGPFAGQLTARYGPRPVLVAASACLITAMAALTQLTTSSPLPFLIGAYLLIGAAWGLLNPPLTNTAIGAMPRDQAGIASATVGASRQLGTVLGVAVMGSVLASRTQALLRDRAARRPFGPAHPAAIAGHFGSQASRAAFTTATHFSYAIGLAAAIAVMIVVIITMQPAPTSHAPPQPPHH